MSTELEHKRSPGDHPHREIPERSYRKPPVVEALCEIYFADSTWDDTIPGAFYERVKDEFPRKQQREIQEAQITLGQGTASAGVQRLPPWMQFLSENSNLMIQVAENLLVVNQLPPYRHFEDWEQVVYKALDVYEEVALPQRVARIGLRYINRIEISGTKISMEDYFTIYPQLPQSLGNTHGPFLVRVEVPQAEQGHTVLITFGTPVPPQPMEGKQAFMLDLYDMASLDIPLDEIELKKEIQRAHNNVVMAFEDSITDQLRDLLEMEEQT
jgi:uncharacterized protein (TIGR04255 family)